MLLSRITSTGNWLIALIVASLLLWRLLLYVHSPLYGVDPVWYMSQTYSLLHGDLLSSTFAHSSLQPYLLPYMYSVLSAPLFALLGHVPISLTIWNLLILAGIAAMVRHLCRQLGIKSVLLRMILTLSFIASSYLYGPRPEVVNILLALVILCIVVPIRDKRMLSSLHLIAIGCLMAIIGLVQPVGGVFSIALLVMFGIWYRLPLRFYAITLATTSVLVILLYLPVILINPETWFYDFFTRFAETDGRGRVDILLFIKYVLYHPFVFIPFALSVAELSKKHEWRKVILSVIGMILLVIILTPFSRSYYYPYIMVYIVWMIMENGLSLLPSNINRLILTGTAIAMPLFSHYYPTLQHIENPMYGAQARLITSTLSTLVEQEPQGMIWVPANVAMYVIQSPNARLYYPNVALFSGQQIRLTSRDTVYLITDPAQSNLLENLAHSMDDLQITSIVPTSVDGLITVDFPDIGRSEPIGLWEVRLKP